VLPQGEASYSSASDVLSNHYGPGHVDEIASMVSSDLGLSMSSLTGDATGTVSLTVAWNDPNPEPAGPNHHRIVTSFVTPEGLTVTIITQCSGTVGDGSASTAPGGYCWTLISVTDADGNVSWLNISLISPAFVRQSFRREDLIRDNAEVQILGPAAIDEDTPEQWKVVVPDSNLPEEDDNIFDVMWTGPPSGEWQAPGGDPASGSGETFTSKYITPGAYTIAVEATREYQFKTYRSEPNPSYVAGTSPISEGFIQVLTIMTGTVRGSATLGITVADITPPNIDFTMTASHEPNHIDVKEEPLDKIPPKTVSVNLSGRNFLLEVGTMFTLNTVAAAGDAIVIGPSLDPSLIGFVVRQHERFKLAATVADNVTPAEAILLVWQVDNVTTGETIIPPGQVEYVLIRKDNLDSMEIVIISVSATDNAGNVTKIEIPVLVIPQNYAVDALGLESARKN